MDFLNCGFFCIEWFLVDKNSQERLEGGARDYRLDSLGGWGGNTDCGRIRLVGVVEAGSSAANLARGNPATRSSFNLLGKW